MKLFSFTILVFSLSALLPLSAFAQDSSLQPKASSHAFSIHAGPLLPNSFPSTDEVLKTFGFRYGYPLGTNSHLETGFSSSNSKGVKYQNIDLSLRGEIPFQDVTFMGLGGFDLLRTRAPGGSFGTYGSFHMGTGLLTNIVNDLFFRIEMRFNLHPGTALIINFGLEYRL